MSQATPQQSAEEIAAECLDLHYARWDSLGREESSIPNDVAEAGHSFMLVSMPLSSVRELDNPSVEILENKVSRFRTLIRTFGWEKVPPPVLGRDLSPIDGWHRAIALLEEGINDAFFWIPCP